MLNVEVKGGLEWATVAGEGKHTLTLYMGGDIIKKSTDPLEAGQEWEDQAFTLAVRDFEGDVFKIGLFKVDDDAGDVKLGAARIPVSEFELGEKVERTCQLVTKEGEEIAKVVLTFERAVEDVEKDSGDDWGETELEIDAPMEVDLGLPDVEVPDKPDLVLAEHKRRASDGVERGPCRISIFILEAENVAGEDRLQIIESYVVGTVVGHKKRLRTRSRCNTISPEWNTEFTFHVESTHGEAIELTVKDTVGDGNEVLSTVVLSLMDVVEGGDDWLQLSGPSGEDAGKIHLKTAIVPTNEGSDDDADEYDPPVEEWDGYEGSIQVAINVGVMEVSGVERVDSEKLADLACRVRVKPNHNFYKTKIIPRTMTPTWNENFEFKLSDFRKGVLCIDLLDNSEMHKTTTIGTITLPMKRLARGPIDDWISVRMTRNGQFESGVKVHLVISMKDAEKLSDDDDDVSVSDDDLVEEKHDSSSSSSSSNSTSSNASEKEDHVRSEVLMEYESDDVESVRYDDAEALRILEEDAQRAISSMTDNIYERVMRVVSQAMPIRSHEHDTTMVHNAECVREAEEALADPDTMSLKRLESEIAKIEKCIEDVDTNINALTSEVSALKRLK